MAYVSMSLQNVLDIMRKVIGQRDSSAPDATNDILLQYINEFIQLNLPNDIKIQDNWTYYEFSTVADQIYYPLLANKTTYPEDANETRYTVVSPPAYSIDDNSPKQNSIKMFWYQSPERFYSFWGYIDDTSALTSGQPTDILYYNQVFELRPMPDAVYSIKMKGYEINESLEATDTLPLDYTYRYIAYGAARDYLRDFLDTETLAQIEPGFQEYRTRVLERTAAQNLYKIKQARF